LSTKAPKITAGGFTLNVVNPTKAFPNAYPICTYTYVIIPQVSKSAVALKKIMKFAISDKGQAYGDALLFEPMPKKVVTASTDCPRSNSHLESSKTLAVPREAPADQAGASFIPVKRTSSGWSSLRRVPRSR